MIKGLVSEKSTKLGNNLHLGSGLKGAFSDALEDL